jgi:hypothetical protein
VTPDSILFPVGFLLRRAVGTIFYFCPPPTAFLFWNLAFAAVEFSILLFSTAGIPLFMPVILLPGGRVPGFSFLYRRILSVYARNPFFRR